MADLSYEEIAAGIGTTVADGLVNIANAAGDFACTLYQNNPLAAVGLADPTGIGAFSNALYSRLCSPRDMLPAPPSTPPFSGGQCPKLYNLTATVIGASEEGPFPPDTRTFNDIQGPLTGFYQEVSTDSDGKAVYTVFFGTADGPLSWGVQGIGAAPSWSIDSLVPSDGSPDDCGNTYPWFPPSNPTPDEYETDKEVDFGGPVITVPIAIIPVILKPEFNFRPQINVRVGPVQVTFDLGGVNFNLYGGQGGDRILPPGKDPRPIPPAPQPPKIGPGCDITPVINKLKALDQKYEPLLNCDRCDDKYNYPVTIFEPAGSRQVTGVAAKLYRVSVDMTDYPVNARKQQGRDADSVLYAGWFSFMIGTRHLDRKPLSWDHNIFVAPEGATGFSYTCYDFYEAACRYERKVPK